MADAATMDRRRTRAGRSSQRSIADVLAAGQRDISVSEFFAKNRHLLGFDSPRKALLTAVKEAVDNSLDACEEAKILPEVSVVIEDLQPDRSPQARSSRYRITVVDNGPGIVRRVVEDVFGRLLFGSKFHRLKMSRGQQGIGISAAGMYGLITTGRPMQIQTRPRAGRHAHHIELAMNTRTNRAEVVLDEETDDFPLRRLREISPAVRRLADAGEFLDPAAHPTGTSVSIELEGRYQRGRGSLDEFVELTAIANPHARLVYVPPRREYAQDAERSTERAPGSRKREDAQDLLLRSASSEPLALPATIADGSAPSDFSAARTQDLGDVIVYPRGVAELPPETREIQPHPRGVELGTLLQMLRDFEGEAKGGALAAFLRERFCRVSPATAGDLCRRIGVPVRTKVADLAPERAEALYNAFQEVRLKPPPTDCLAPIGARQLFAGLLKGVRAEFYAASSREPAVYRGRPFQVEAAIAFGGELPAEEPARVIRFANRVPLLYQQSACASFRAVVETNWRNYDLQQPRGSLPVGPLVIMVHIASVWVPFTSESKEAIADYDEIGKELRLALQECGRKLGAFVRKREHMRRESERRVVFEKYIGEIARACGAITGTDAGEIHAALLRQAQERTAIADALLDDDGRLVRDPPSQREQTGGSADRRPPQRKGAEKKAAFKGARKAPPQPPPPGEAGEGPPSPSVPPRRPPSRTSGPAPTTRPSKPRARLVGDRLVPIDDDPGLF